MAFDYQLFGTMNFVFADHDEYSSFRTSAITFVTNKGGAYDLDPKEHGDGTSSYTAGFKFLIPVTGLTQAETYIGQINTALASLPAHSGLRYKVIISEIPD